MSYTKAVPTKESVSGNGEFLTDINHLIGFTLGHALELASEKGYIVEKISITSPPRLEICEYDHSFRVLRVQALGDKKLAILVCKPL